jgi:hypothetical protein
MPTVGLMIVAAPRYHDPVRPVAERILDAFQLTRLSLAFGAVCELWLLVCARADGTSGGAAASVAVAVGEVEVF